MIGCTRQQQGGIQEEWHQHQPSSTHASSFSE